MTDDGVALYSTAHPRAPWWQRLWMCLRRPRLSPESLETMEIPIMGVRITPAEVEACTAAMRMEQAEEDYIRAIRTQYKVTGYDEQSNIVTVEKVVNDKAIEQEIKDKGLTAPRITLADIEKVIVAECYTTGDYIPVETAVVDVEQASLIASLECLTVCVLVLKNGFTVVGESACASRKNFDSALGRKIARQNAVDKIWMLEGYLLKERLHWAPTAVAPKAGA